MSLELEKIIEGATPEDRERAQALFHSMLKGDPDSLPVQLALVLKGSLSGISAAIESEKKIHEAHLAVIKEYEARAATVTQQTHEIEMSFFRGNKDFSAQMLGYMNEIGQISDEWIFHRNVLKKEGERLEQGIKDVWKVTESNNRFIQRIGKLWIKEAALASAIFLIIGIGIGYFLRGNIH